MKRFLGFAVFLVFLASCCILPASAESTSYQVKILYTRNGTVTVDRSAAAPGEQVTVTAVGNTGYRPYISTSDDYSAASIYCGEQSIAFDWLTNQYIVGEEGDSGASEFVFTMPEGDVTVRIPFVSLSEAVPGFYTVTFSLETVDASGNPVQDSVPHGRIEGGGQFVKTESGYVIVIPEEGWAYHSFRCEPERNDIEFSMDDYGHRVLFWGGENLQDFHITVFLASTAPKRIPGDADANGAAELSDALLILQYMAGENVTINIGNADVSGDGEADIQDALLILQYVCGWDVTLR